MKEKVVVPTVDVLIVAGFQVPVMPFTDVAGNTGGAEFLQSGSISAKAGVMEADISTIRVAGEAH